MRGEAANSPSVTPRGIRVRRYQMRGEAASSEQPQRHAAGNPREEIMVSR